MTRTYHFVTPVGFVECRLGNGTSVRLPVIPGILKHPRVSELPELLEKESVARKYSRLALEKAAWQILKHFPQDWLIRCLDEATLSAGRRNALRYLLGLDRSPFLRLPA